jgi:hypothetical protein
MSQHSRIITVVDITQDNKEIITTSCDDLTCPYNGENSPMMRSNASILQKCSDTGREYTLDERSGNYMLCPHRVTHQVITKSFN